MGSLEYTGVEISDCVVNISARNFYVSGEDVGTVSEEPPFRLLVVPARNRRVFPNVLV